MPDSRQTQPTIRNSQSVVPYDFCTYFDHNYLSRGLVLYQSLVRYCRQPFVLWVLCFDEETHRILSRLDLPAVRLVSQQEFEAGDEALVRAKADRSRFEYYWTCTPSLPLYILQKNPQVKVVTYLDADLCFYGNPQPIYDELREGSVLIVEHRYPSEHMHLAATWGTYNVGLLAFRNDERALACLSWWRERCLEWCSARAEGNRFGDQKYLDDWPTRFPGVVVLQHKGAGLAPWNLSRYRVCLGQPTPSVDGQPLVFYHFHGFKAVNRYMAELAPYEYRISVDQALRLYLPYALTLLQAAKRVVPAVATEASTAHSQSPVRLLKGLVEQRYLWTAHRWLAALFWSVGGRRRAAQARLAAGFASYWAGNLQDARRQLASAMRIDPSVCWNSGVLSIVTESWLGSERMRRYRRWRHPDRATGC